ncbi:unnamed protein product [Phytophthora fragariaefolia]|uniref:Unnamed protein product n=1 Tax=Phytophthora fragariaefolia TaxID=1490495 RepID=A0A9W7D088_9STRA|nr:unnamed protein product [Phytophthora fragariaefolia]
MELLSKFTALTTAVGETAVDYAKKNHWIWSLDRAFQFMGFVVVIHGTNLVVMILVALMSLLGDESFRIRFKQIVGRLSFSDTSRGISDASSKDVIMKWNVKNEAKHRIWQPFWRAVLLAIASPDEDQRNIQVRPNETERVGST